MNQLYKSNSKDIIKKVFNFSVDESKQVTLNGMDFGVIKGFASTYNNVDRGNDVIRPGAFNESIERHKRLKRQVRMLFQHNQDFPIGGFPADEIVDQEKGLYVVGYINLKADKGLSTYELVKQGVISDLSIGFLLNDSFIDENGVNNLTDIELFEISLVTEPMNPLATITEFKGATTFQDLPLASREREWSSDEALKRVREFTESSENNASSDYKRAFFWFDSQESDNLTAYKLPFADVIDGELKAVPRGIFAAAAAMEGARGGVDIPDSDRMKVERHINRYYDKMDMESPLKNFDIDNIKSIRDVEKFLKSKLGLSASKSKRLISKIKSFEREVSNGSQVTRDADQVKLDNFSKSELALKLSNINQLINKGGKNVSKHRN